MHCTHCGAALEAGEAFCGNCGQPVRTVAPPVAPGPTPYYGPTAPPPAPAQAPSAPRYAPQAPLQYMAAPAYPARRAPAPGNNWGWFSIGCVIGVVMALASLAALVFVLYALSTA